MKPRIPYLVLLLTLAFLTACAPTNVETPAPEDPEEPEVTTLTYAILSPENVNLEAINQFNRAHKDVQIETRSYATLSENGKQGMDLLMVELAAGQVPDIIDLGSDGQLCQLSYRQLAKKGYLEDLWPYIDNDPGVGREGVVETFLKPAEVDGGLYVLYDSVKLCTLLGAESVVGDRTSWSLDEMRETFASMPNGELLMDNFTNYGTEPSMKRYLLNSILSGFIDLFVDLETGQCSFDSQQFRDVLEFVREIPDTPDEYEWNAECSDLMETYEAHVVRLRKGAVMLRARELNAVRAFRTERVHFGEPVVPIGYPLGEGVVGSYYEPRGSKLAMSSTCKDKDAAWEFIRDMVMVDSKTDSIPNLGGLPISRKAYTTQTKDWYEPKMSVVVGSQSIRAEKETKEGLDQVTAFLNSITRCSLFLEPAVLEMIEEQASAYFAGAIPLDEIVARIQTRATLYMNEHM